MFARALSALKEDRVATSGLVKQQKAASAAIDVSLEDVRQALYASKVCAYAQGFSLMAAAAKEHRWELNFADLARIWRGGCIIRARLLHTISEAFERNRKLGSLLVDPHFATSLHAAQPGWRRVVARAALEGVAVPAFSSALAYFDGSISPQLPANLLQAQRDFFGAHLYERVDAPRGKRFHLEWLLPGRPQRAVEE